MMENFMMGLNKDMDAIITEIVLNMKGFGKMMVKFLKFYANYG